MGRTPPGQTRERVFRLVRDRLLAGSPPTVREVQQAFGFRSVQTAREHLEALVLEGRLGEISGCPACAGLVIAPGNVAPPAESSWIEVMTTGSAGVPSTTTSPKSVSSGGSNLKIFPASRVWSVDPPKLAGALNA